MGNRTCATCSKCKTAACEAPDKCVPSGYKYYSGQTLPHWQYCRGCGARLITRQTVTETADTSTMYMLCPMCAHVEKVQRACLGGE